MSNKFGSRMIEARKKKEFSREELAAKIGTSGPIIGRYERGDMIPSIEIATKIADALTVSLDFLVGKSSLIVKDTEILERMEDIAQLPDNKKIELFNVMDAYLRDFRTGKAFLK
jgi:transcriptional regulator with XRE-family HTH domain